MDSKAGISVQRLLSEHRLCAIFNITTGATKQLHVLVFPLVSQAAFTKARPSEESQVNHELLAEAKSPLHSDHIYTYTYIYIIYISLSSLSLSFSLSLFSFFFHR